MRTTRRTTEGEAVRLPRGGILFLIALFLAGWAGCATEREIQPFLPNDDATVVTLRPGTEPYGLGGIEWETDLSSLQGMEYYRTDPSHGGIEFYVRKGEALKIGGEIFPSVQYGFWNRKFYVGMITVRGPANWDVLKRAIFKHYGEGAKPFVNREEYLWVGENVAMALRYDEASKDGMFYVRCARLLKNAHLSRGAWDSPCLRQALRHLDAGIARL